MERKCSGRISSTGEIAILNDLFFLEDGSSIFTRTDHRDSVPKLYRERLSMLMGEVNIYPVNR